MLKEEFQYISSTNRDVRNFGLLVGGVLAAIGGWMLYKDSSLSSYFLGAGGLLVVLGLVAPAVLRPLQRVWMKMAVVMGFIMTRVILGFLFFLVFVPIGLLGRMFGKQFLEVKIDRSAQTHWNYRPKEPLDKSRIEAQF